MTEQALYSGWRVKKGLGFFGFSQNETIALAGSLFLILIVAGRRPTTLFVTAPLFLLAALVLTKFGGVSGVDRLRREFGFYTARKRQFLDYRNKHLQGEPLAPGERLKLPGLLAPTRLLGRRDGFSEWGIVWDQSNDFLTTTFICNSQSPQLADDDVFNIWVAQWHQFMASLASEPQIEYVTVTVDSANEGGATVTENLRRSLVPSASVHAYDVLTSLGNLGVDQASYVETRISITFNPNKGPARKKAIGAKVAEISRLLYGLESRLSACGLSAIHRASPADLSARMKTSFDRSAKDTIVEGMLKGVSPMRWSQAGPRVTREERNHFLHDTGASVSWVWNNGPRSPVPATILGPLVNPGPYPKKVTLIYEPSDPAAVSRKLEQERTALDAKRMLLNQSPQNETQRQKVDREFATLAAQEEARGAGFGDLSMFVTVTVPNESLLDDAKTDIKSRAAQAKVSLREATCSQAAVFYAGLSAGIHPAYKINKGFF